MEEELTVDTATDLLSRCIVVAQSKGVFSIKDASYLYVVLGKIKTEKTKEFYDYLIKAVVLANSKGVYTLEEAFAIDKTVQLLEKENLLGSVKKESRFLKKE